MEKDKSKDPSNPSIAHRKLYHMWEMIEDIREGAKSIRGKGEEYLIKFPAEDDGEYKRRLKSAPWRAEFVDAIQTLSAKPFTKQVKLDEGASEQMQALASNIDGRGNNLHVFAKDLFECGVSMGSAGILVDFPSGQSGRTVAEERAAGVRPYWVEIDADDILEVVFEQRGGEKVCTYLRIEESRIERNGFEQTHVDLIREIKVDPGTAQGVWTIWREEQKKGSLEKEWVEEEKGELTLDRVPFVLYATGDIDGDQYVKPPLIDLADMQIELYNALSKKERVFTISASPMLTANGMAAPDNNVVETGPGRVLYAPGVEGISTSWAYLQPNAANLKEIRDDIDGIIADMRRLGMQPMISRSGNTPAIGVQLDGERSYTILQSWALGLKDALEQAWLYTAMWLKNAEAAPSVVIHTDFAVGMYGASEITELNKARESGQISRETYWAEMVRRGFLAPDFDPAEEQKRLDKEAPPFDATTPDPFQT